MKRYVQPQNRGEIDQQIEGLRLNRNVKAPTPPSFKDQKRGIERQARARLQTRCRCRPTFRAGTGSPARSTRATRSSRSRSCGSRETVSPGRRARTGVRRIILRPSSCAGFSAPNGLKTRSASCAAVRASRPGAAPEYPCRSKGSPRPAVEAPTRRRDSKERPVRCLPQRFPDKAPAFRPAPMSKLMSSTARCSRGFFKRPREPVVNFLAQADALQQRRRHRAGPLKLIAVVSDAGRAMGGVHHGQPRFRAVSQTGRA